jgi:hypothetical protein
MQILPGSSDEAVLINASRRFGKMAGGGAAPQGTPIEDTTL